MDPEEPTQDSQQQDPQTGPTQDSAFSFGEGGQTGENTGAAEALIPDSQSVISATPGVTGSVAPRRNFNAGSFLGSQMSRSDLLSTQLSVNSRQSGATLLRGDIQRTGALERYLHSDVRSEVRPTSPGVLSSQGNDYFGAAPVIWGTTINIEDSMGMFRDFMSNYTSEGDIEPFYSSYLEHVRCLICLLLFL